VDKIPVAILGATGLVGQRFVDILSKHPWFKVEYVAASERSVGLKYADAVDWALSKDMPESVAALVVGSVYDVPDDIEIVFSALPSSIAEPVEISLARQGFVVVSNASPLRMEPDVPLLNPEVNYDHLDLLKVQGKRRAWKGRILKNPNCTTAILTLSLAPILNEYGIEQLMVTTMQAISGAGLRGVPAYLITDNVIPYIEKEEVKIAVETRKILGRFSNKGKVEPLELSMAVTATRVPVLDGHMEVVYVKTSGSAEPLEVMDILGNFRSIPQELKLPTAPSKPVVVRKEKNRPQHRLDRLAGNGMSVTVGRVEKMEELGDRWIRYVVLGHNTIRGAAGTAVLIAELYAKTAGFSR